ncbi:hypothetical protein G7Y89_g683 [Cudoniella acicularis]|uniref:Peroxidase n=1 Tax=Cudoniella acicularis TaxID=354080 RepID=A0A8H4RZH4_9HELO|nr:hypothetical protein G7Y89_g683 [Cudoniella acicularis]
MWTKFKGTSGRCNAHARAAVRLGFHDAGSWNKYTPVGYGGADGSLILAGEISHLENNGLQNIVQIIQGWYNEYHTYGVRMADLVQMGATVATVTCPLGPHMRSFVGGKDSYNPSPEGLLPNVFVDADSLIRLFQDKTIESHGLAALDSMPGVWDILFYPQTINKVAVPPRVLKFQSDEVLSAHPDIEKYVRLSLLGVNNINKLTECTSIFPAAVNSYTSPDQNYLNEWLGGSMSSIGGAVSEAVTLTTGFWSRLVFIPGLDSHDSLLEKDAIGFDVAGVWKGSGVCS